MYLDARSLAIFKEIIHYPQQKSKELEKKFDLSRRQVNYSIEKVNLWLSEFKFQKIQRLSNGHFSVDKAVINYFSETMASQKQTDTYIFDELERQQILLLSLIGKNSDLSLDDLSELLAVSRNTTSKDLKAAEHMLRDFQLTIQYSRIDGFKLAGEEMAIRRLINYLVPKMMTIANFSDFFAQIMKVDKQWFLKKIQAIEEQLGIHYTDISFHELPFILILNLHRWEQHHPLAISEPFSTTVDPINETAEYRVIVSVLSSVMPAAVIEKEWLVLQMLTANMRSAHLSGQLKQGLEQAIQTFLQRFEEKSVLLILDKANLIQKLLVHMYPAYYRIKYGVNTNYILLDKITTDYVELFELVKQSVGPIELAIGKQLPDGEIAYLTIFLGGELLKQGLNIETKKRAVVVCTNGISISKLLKYTLSKLFPEFIFRESLSIRQFDHYEQPYDVVFSMVPLKSDKPVFIVNPLMTKEEQQLLKYHVLTELKEHTTDFLVRDILGIVKKYAEVTYEQKLVDELETFMKAPTIQGPVVDLTNELPDLTTFLKSQRVLIKDRVKDWQAGIRLACQPLLEEQLISEVYVESLLVEHNRHELYCFLGNYLAIPHTLPENGVQGDGFSMLILKEPVLFANGRPISVIVPLAILSQTSHLRAIVQLAELSENNQDMLALMAATNQQSAYEVIEKYK
ncbi:transcription antiterminator [Vagococcus sp. BWB3-3]|uniref:Ascorbate-specific PTS system EIIA component n=1 Tax=Vagococcus allomyrinae TaxID=2794353 RepID=A0A940PAP0_9ENTE|nr:BglG family transcription antiterminator [Vagococcus allomyrinae]MBP1039951.1 transcription antiterminator [Vagococcus allomyrinae]